MDGKKLVKFTLASTAAALAARGAGLAFNVFLTRRAGAECIGLLTVVNSVYALGVTFSAAGFRLATTRRAVEDEASDTPDAKTLVLRIAALALAVGTLAAAALYFGAGAVAEFFLRDARCRAPIAILALSLPLCAVESVFSAYLSAFYKLVKAASVQALSQAVQIGFVVLTLGAGESAEACCTRIAVGTVAGEAAACALAAVLCAAAISKKRRVKTKKPFLAPFLKIAVPDALGYDLRSALSTVQHLFIPIGLRKAGEDAASALAAFGVMHGMALQVVLFPSCVLRALSGLLVPTVAKSMALGRRHEMQRTVRRTLRATLLFSFACASVMLFSAENLAAALYGIPACAGFIRLFSPLVPVMYLDICVDAMLKGLDCQVASMGYNLLDSFLSMALVYFLIPVFGVTGYVVMVFVTETLNTGMSLAKLVRESGVGLSPVRDVLFPLFAAAASGAVGLAVGRLLGAGVPSLILQIAATAAAFVLFAAALLPADRKGGIKAKALT